MDYESLRLAYEREGTLRLKPAVQIPKFADLDYNPNTETEWYQQVTAYTECLYDYRTSADFILNLDIDDLIIPRNFDTLTEELGYLSNLYPRASSFEFIWATTQARGSKHPDTFSIHEMMGENSLDEFVDYGKSAIRPERVNQGYGTDRYSS